MTTTTTLKLCLVTQTETADEHYQNMLREAITGGVSCVQLRIKNKSFQASKALALSIKALLDELNTPLIINDHVELACEIDAAGVHLGQEDMPAVEARKLLGENKIIGLSIESMSELMQANQIKQLDYVAASAIFPTKNKNNLKMIWGIDGLKNFVAAAKHPVIAIGGINASNVKQIMQTGVTGIAVIGAIHDASNPKLAAQQLIRQIAYV